MPATAIVKNSHNTNITKSVSTLNDPDNTYKQANTVSNIKALTGVPDFS